MYLIHLLIKAHNEEYIIIRIKPSNCPSIRPSKSFVKKYVTIYTTVQKFGVSIFSFLLFSFFQKKVTFLFSKDVLNW